MGSGVKNNMTEEKADMRNFPKNHNWSNTANRLKPEAKHEFLTLDQRAEHAETARKGHTLDTSMAADTAMGLDDEAGPPGVFASPSGAWDRVYAQFLKHGGSMQRCQRPFFATTPSSSGALSPLH